MAPPDAPRRYQGELSQDGAADGIAALSENANRLARDARILFHARRYASAAMLAAMALAETARISWLLAVPAAVDGVGLRRAWRRFREAPSDFPWAMCHGGRPQMSDEATNRMIDFIREFGARVDCLNGGAWAQPERVVSRPLAQQLVEMAELVRMNPIDPAPLRVWMEVVEAAPEDAPDEEVLARFKCELDAQGLGRYATLLP